MKKFTLDKKIFDQVTSANKDYSSFGIENSPNKIDYIQLYVTDMNDKVLARDYLSQDEISVVDNQVVDLDIGQHLRNMGFTEGDYKVKYYFMSALAGLPSNADNYGEASHYYLNPDQTIYWGKIKKRMLGDEEQYFYLNNDGTEEIPLKKIENKYLLLNMSPDKTEVEIDAQNIASWGYKDKLRSIMRQKPIPRWGYSYANNSNRKYPAGHLQFDKDDPTIIKLIPQYDGDPGFDPEVVGKPISIREVYEFQGPEVSVTGISADPALANPMSPEFQQMIQQGYNPQEIIDMSTQEVESRVRDTIKMRFKSRIVEVLDFDTIRVEKSFVEYESEARDILQKKLEKWNGEDEEIEYYDTGYDLPQTIKFGDGEYAPQTQLDQSMFQQVADKNRLLVPEPVFPKGKPRGNAWVVWAPQTDFNRCNTYLVVNDQYYLIARGTEGYGLHGTIWGGPKDGTYAPSPGKPAWNTQDVLNRYFKLYKPLEKDIEQYDLVYFAEEKLEPYEDKIRLIPFEDDFDNDIQFLRIPNMNSKDNPVRPRRTNFKNFNTLNGNNNLVKDKLTEKIFSGSLLDTRLNIDYGRRNAEIAPDQDDYGFGKFINYGSAEKRVENFKKKLTLIETYTSQSGVFSNISSSVETQTKYRKLKNNVINSFDHFEHYMYYESSSYTTSSLGERYDVTWPKTSYSNNVYTLTPVTSSLGISHYNTWNTRAKEFDIINKERFISNLPAHVSMDPSNNTFLDFFDMMGQQFDEYWLYTRHFTDVNERTSRLGEGISKDLVEQVAKSIGLNLVNGNDLLELPEYLLGTNTTGSAVYSTPQEDVTKEIYKRILSNMPFFSKSKGSIRAMKGLLNCYGIPSSILRVREYGGPDIGERVSYEIKRKFNYALDFKGSQYVQHTWRADTVDNTYPDTVEFRFRTPYSVGNSGSMAIVQTNDRWAIGLKDNGTTDSYGNLFFALSGSNSSAASCSIDGLPFYNDDMWSVMLTRASSSGAQLTSASPGSKIKYELTAKQYDSTREVILYQGSSSFVADGSGGNNTNGYEQNEYWTTSTNTRLGGNANGKFGSMFSGSLMEYRLWTEVLSQEKFNDHVKAPKSYVGNTTSSAYEKLVFKLPLNDNINLSSNNVDDKSARTTYEANGTPNGFTGNFFRSIVDKEEVKIPNIGPNRRNATKIRIEDQQLGNRMLSPETRVAASAYDTAPIDSNKVGIYFSPVDVINEDIMYSMADFDFDDLVGDPRDEFEPEFRGLENEQRKYWKKYSSPNNFWDYLRILKYYDSGIFDQIRSFIPARVNATLGILIEPNMLERDKEVIGKLPEIDNNYFENANQFQEGLQISNNKSGSDAAAITMGGEFYQNEGSLNLTGYTDKVGEPGAGANGSLNINTLNSLDKIDGKTPFGSTYVSASITFGGTIQEFTETIQPNISSSRISAHNQIKRLFYSTPENAKNNVPSSASFHPAEYESMALDSSLFRVYYKPVTLTKKNTIDGKEPVEITITSPTTLISQEPGESPLKVE